MCKVLNLTSKKTAVGYKVVIKKGNRYYSPCTGLQYKKGMTMPVIKKRRKNVSAFYRDVLSDETLYEPKMEGRTGVLRDLEDATIICDNIKRCSNDIIYENNIVSHATVILKMTIGGDIYNGTTPTAMFSTARTFIGSEIIDFTEL